MTLPPPLNPTQVCSDGVRLDHLTLWGVSNPNNFRYYHPSPNPNPNPHSGNNGSGGGASHFQGSHGYFAFAPSQLHGQPSDLVAFYGQSASFSKPIFGGQEFTGPLNTWYLNNLATDAGPGAIIQYPSVPVSALLYDTESSIVYDPSPSAGQQDFDLSSATPRTANPNPNPNPNLLATATSLGLADLGLATGGYAIRDLAVHGSVYYGLRLGAAFNFPSDVAVDGAGNVYVADTRNNLVRRIDAVTDAVMSLGTSADPSFITPCGVAVDGAGNVYVTDSESSLVRRIDAVTDAVTSMGTSADPSFITPGGVAVDGAGNVYVADTLNSLVRRIDVATHAVTRFLGAPRVFQWDMRYPPASYTLWPDTALDDPSLAYLTIDVVDSAAGGCQHIKRNSLGNCYLLAHADYNAETARMYLEFREYDRKARYTRATYLVTLDPSAAHVPSPIILLLTGPTPSRQLWGVFKMPLNGTVLYTSLGAVSPEPNSFGMSVILSHTGSRYTSLVNAPGTSIVDASKIPGLPRGGVRLTAPRFLLLQLNEKGFHSMNTYDTFTDTLVSSNAAVAATTNYMLAYTWGLCAGNVTRSLVEIHFNNVYSNVCKQPHSGLYYQSPNRYFAIPYTCLGIAYDKLLTDCPDIKANMAALVGLTCQASIEKVCREQYDNNPPFTCTSYLKPSVLSVLSLSFSNTMAVATLLAFVVARLLSLVHHNRYNPTEADMALANADMYPHEAQDKSGANNAHASSAHAHASSAHAHASSAGTERGRGDNRSRRDDDTGTGAFGNNGQNGLVASTDSGLGGSMSIKLAPSRATAAEKITALERQVGELRTENAAMHRVQAEQIERAAEMQRALDRLAARISEGRPQP